MGELQLIYTLEIVFNWWHVISGSHWSPTRDFMDEVAKARPKYVPNYSARIQRGISTSVDEPSHSQLPPGGLSFVISFWRLNKNYCTVLLNLDAGHGTITPTGCKTLPTD